MLFLASSNEKWEWRNLTAFIDYFLNAATLVVVAVPEGLPMAVTISLAYSMKSMLKDKNLVRHLAACETMGGATSTLYFTLTINNTFNIDICSDKTGTLTENRMTVTSIWMCDSLFQSNIEQALPQKIDHSIINTLNQSVCVNSSAHLRNLPDGKMEFIGSKTECALLLMSQRLSFDYVKLRKDEEVLTK